MTRPTFTTAVASLGFSVVLLGSLHTAAPQSAPPHAGAPRPLDTFMFAPSTDCLACHNSLVGPGGDDVSIGAGWRGTMMANSGRDPYVRASIRREILDHRSSAAAIEDECAGCHLPAARAIAHTAGQRGEVFAHFAASPDAATPLDRLARDGVTCTVCHQIASSGLGTRGSFNGNSPWPTPTPADAAAHSGRSRPTRDDAS